MNLFRVRGIQLAVHFSFLLLLALFAVEGWMRAEWSGVFWNIATLLVFFTCVVLHELGHSFTAMRFGVGVRRILLMPIGGMAEFDSIPRQPGREFLITIAGPAVNFAIATVVGFFVGMPPGWPFGSYDFEANAVGFAQLVVHWNLLMGIFNLVPVFPMDGGRIFRATLAARLPYLRATYIAATVGKVLAIAASVAAIVFWQELLIAALFVFIFFAGDIEYRALKRREMEDAHWRAVLSRLYDVPPPTEEPPVLRP